MRVKQLRAGDDRYMDWLQREQHELWGRIKRLVLFGRRHGWRRGLYRTWHGLSQCRSDPGVRLTIVEIMAAPVAQLRQLGRIPKALGVRFAETADLPLLDRLIGQAGKAAQRFAAQDRCLLATSEEQILATEWIKLGPSTYAEDAAALGVIFRVPPKACWLYDGKTIDDAQVIGPWGAAMGRLRTYLEQLGMETAYLQVGYHNQYSIACHENLGFRIVGRLFCLQLFGRCLVGHREVGGHWRLFSGEKFDLRCLPLARVLPACSQVEQKVA